MVQAAKSEGIGEQLRNRLRSRGRIDADTGCVEYTGSIGQNGYGAIQAGGKGWTTHRLAWNLFVGPIPNGRLVLHHCDNKPCFNIDHLYLGTHSDNNRDRYERNPESNPVGEQRRNKLRTTDVLLIRRLARNGMKPMTIHRMYPEVTARTIYQIIDRTAWKHLPEENQDGNS